MPALQALSVLQICLACDGKSSRFQSIDTELNAVERHDFFCLASQMFDQFRGCEHTWRSIGFEFGFANKYHH